MLIHRSLCRSSLRSLGITRCYHKLPFGVVQLRRVVTPFAKRNVSQSQQGPQTQVQAMPQTVPQSQVQAVPQDPQRPRPKSSLGEITRLIKLAKPEFGLMGYGLVLLLASSAVSMMLPSVIGKIIDTCKEDSDEESVVILGHKVALTAFYGGILGLFVFGGIANYGRVVILKTVGEKIVARLRNSIFQKLMYQDSQFWDKNKTGDLISRLINDSSIISKSVTQNLNDGLRSVIQGMVGVSMMVTISLKLTGYMVMVFPPLAVIVLVYGRRVKNLSRNIQEQLGSLTKVSEEQFNFVKTIQSFNKESYELGKFGKEVTSLYELALAEARLSGRFYGVTGVIGNATLILLLVLGANLVKTGEMTVGDLSSFMMYSVYTGSSVFSLSNFYSELMKGVGASTRVFELSDLHSEISLSGGKALHSLKGDVVFQNVSFSYPTRPSHSIFRDLSLRVPQGQHMCFVGPSGCGKSTLAQLLLRFYDPQDGDIKIGGESLKTLNLMQTRQRIGFVQQEPMLFAGTIRENILYGKQDGSYDEMIQVSKLANCHDFVTRFPDGYETVIGSKGTQLSGGQKQRIALARTLLLDPDLLILDEATSALDSKAEAAISATFLERHTKGLTTISIAHRLSTIQMSDCIVVLGSDGSIVESGEFSELYANPQSRLNKLLQKSEDLTDTEPEGERDGSFQESVGEKFS